MRSRAKVACKRLSIKFVLAERCHAACFICGGPFCAPSGQATWPHGSPCVPPLAIRTVRAYRPDGRAQEYLGEYKRVSGSNINGQPFFTKSGDSRRGLWHALDGNWFAGLTIVQDQFGHPRGALRIRAQDATRIPPELGNATWEVWNDTEDLWIAAPQVRLTAAVDSLQVAHDEL